LALDLIRRTTSQNTRRENLFALIITVVI